MRKAHCRNWNMARKLKNVKNEKQTLFIWNMARNNKNVKNKNAHCRTWSMAGKLKIMENEKHTLQDMEYGEKH